MPRGLERDAVTPAEDTSAPRVLEFFDYSCPFCYLDRFRIGRLSAEHGAELVYLPFELHPDVPEGGVSALETGLAYSDHVQALMVRRAAEEGVPFTLPDLLPNTRHALALGEFAREAGIEVHERVHVALFAARYAHGRDIGSDDVLLDVAAREGLDTAELARVWAEGTFDERLHRFRHLALAMGVTGTPSAIICNELIIGVRPTHVLQEALDRCVSGVSAPELAPGDEEGAPPAVTGR